MEIKTRVLPADEAGVAEAAQLLHEAVVDLTVGNEKLAEALRILKGEE